MANAKRCDRCGSYYEPYPGTDCGVGNKANRISLQNDFKAQCAVCFDLCPACMDRQIKFLQGSQPMTGAVKDTIYLAPLTLKQVEKLDSLMVGIVPINASCAPGVGYVDIKSNKIMGSADGFCHSYIWNLANIGKTYNAYSVPGKSVPIEAEKEVNKMTYEQLYKLFKQKTGIDTLQINDYRPCVSLYDVPDIPNAIVVWLKSGEKIIFVAAKNENVIDQHAQNY